MLMARREGEGFMTKTWPVKFAGILFFLVGLTHAARLISHFNLIIGDWSVPLWLSAVATLVTLTLSFLLLKK